MSRIEAFDRHPAQAEARITAAHIAATEAIEALLQRHAEHRVFDELPVFWDRASARWYRNVWDSVRAGFRRIYVP